MTSTLASAQYFDSSHETLKKRGLAAVLPFTGQANQADAKQKSSALSANLSNADGSDRKLADYLILGALSIFIHSTVVDRFQHMSFEQEEMLEPVKIPSKVEISIIKPQPKPVAPPPQVKPKPVQKKVVPLEKPKEKPKPVEPVQDYTPAEPVIDAPPAPPVPGPVEKIIPPRGSAGYLNNPPPVYPDIAVDRGWQGKVLLKVFVKANGKPKTVAVLKSSGKKVLDQEAVRTVKKWTFEPARRGITPIEGWVTVPINFSLR